MNSRNTKLCAFSLIILLALGFLFPQALADGIYRCDPFYLYFSVGENVNAKIWLALIDGFIENHLGATPASGYYTSGGTSFPAGLTIDPSIPAAVAADEVDFRLVTGIPTTAGSTTVVLAMDFSSHSTIYGTRTFVILALEPSITAPVIDYVNEKLTSLANGSISFDGQNGTYETIASGERTIDSAWLGTTLWIVKKGDHSTVGDTDPLSFYIPNRPPAPGPLAARIDATPTGGTGAISGTTTAMEYSASATGPWTDCAAGSTTGLAQGTYYVRTKAVAGVSFASEAATITIAANTEKEITSFALVGVPGTITDVTATTGTIDITLPYGTDVTSLAPTFAHTGTAVTVSGVLQTSGASAQDFTSPVTYTVTTADGSTKTYKVTVSVAPNTAKAITAFTINGVPGTISGTNITVTLPFGTVLTNLTPTITVSPGATVSPASGAARNFTNPVTYTVTAQDGGTQSYTVTVRVQPAPSKLPKTGDGFPLGGLPALMGVALIPMCWLGLRLRGGKTRA